MATTPVIKHGTKQQDFVTGAKRDTQEGKAALELISPIFLERLGVHLGTGAKHYGARNWEKGIPIDRTMASLLRHVNAYREGKRDEDHLAAAGFNLMVILHTEEMIRRGKLPPELLDIPSYVVEPEVRKPQLKLWLCKGAHTKFGQTYIYSIQGNAVCWKNPRYPRSQWLVSTGNKHSFAEAVQSGTMVPYKKERKK